MKDNTVTEHIPVLRRLSFKMLLSFALPILMIFGIYLCAAAAVQQKDSCLQTQALYMEKCGALLGGTETEVYRLDSLAGILYDDTDSLAALLKGFSTVGYYEARTRLHRSIRSMLNLTPQPDNMAIHNVDGSTILLCSSDGAFYRGGGMKPWPEGMFDESHRYYLRLGPIPALNVKRSVLTVYRPVQDPFSRQIKAVSIVYEYIYDLEKKVDALALSEKDYVFITDEAGAVLLSNRDGDSEYTPCGSKFGVELVKMNGVKYLHFTSKNTILGWRAEVLSPLPGIFRAGTLAMGVNLLTLFSLLLATVIAASLISQRVTRPLISLASKMAQTGDGSFSKADEYHHKDEVLVITNTYNRMVDDIQTLIHEKYELDNLKLQTELDALQSRINPHFLFNTLNSIKSMCILQDEEEIGEMVQTLADILRFSLDSGTRLIPFREEVAQLRKYNYLQSKRFGTHFQVEYDIPEDAEKLLVPCMTLQPIAENIFKHAISGKGVCQIRLTAWTRDGRFHIQMANTGKVPSQETLDRINRMLSSEHSVPAQHIGLMNLYRRLFLYFGEQSHIRLYCEDGWTITSVDIPAVDTPEARQKGAAHESIAG